MERLSSPMFLGKLQALKEDRRITERLRTQLRHLLLTEMQNGPSARWNPVITVRGRALGSLIVEWLRVHDCHYTLSVLASEIPSLADLPGFAGDGSDTSLQKREAEEILLTLDMKSKRIIDEYDSSSESLLSCIMKIASSWKARLQFTEIPTVPNSSHRAAWNSRIQQLVANSCLDPGEMPALFSALNNIIHTEVEERVDQERRNVVSENLARENKVREQLKKLEDFLNNSLDKAQDEISKNKEKSQKQLLEERRALHQLIADVNQQHQVVIEGLQNLELREQKLEAAQKSWKADVEFEKQRCKRVAQDLANRITHFEHEKELFQRERKFQENLLQNPTTTVSALPKTEQPFVELKIEESGESPKKSAISNQSRLKTTKSSSSERSRSPLQKFSDRSSSSVESASQSSGATAAAWARLKELREETKRKSEEFHERRIELCSDSDSPPELSVPQTGDITFRVHRHSQVRLGDCISVLRGQVAVRILRTVKTSRRRRMYEPSFPTLHDACLESPSSDRHPTHAKRYKHLLGQGDPKIRRPSLQTRIPKMPDVNSSKGSDVNRRLRYQTDRLNNLIQSARQSTPQQSSVRLGAKERQEKAKEKKMEVLLHSVRDSPSAEDGCNSITLIEKNGEVRQDSSPKKMSRIPVSAGATPDLTLKRKFDQQAGTSSSLPFNSKEATVEEENFVSTTVPEVPEEIESVSLRETSTRTSRPSSLPVRKDSRPPLLRTYTMPPTSLIHATLDSSSPLSDGEVISIGQSGGDFWS